MKTILGLTFWLRTDKMNSKGTVPLSCRLSIRGRKAELSTGIRLAPKDWNGPRRKVLGTSEAAKRANSYLLQMQNELEDLVADLDRQGKVVTAQNLARLYRKPTTSGQTLLELYGAFLAERAGLVGVELAQATTKSNRTRYNRLRDFLTAHQLTALLPEEVTHNLADKLLHWCMKQRDFKRNTANKQIHGLSQVLKWGVRREFIDKNPLELYEYREQRQGEIKYLTVSELAQLTQANLLTSNLERARDCFVFQCWTGLAYADLAAINVARDARYHTDKVGNLRRTLYITRAKSTMQKGYECVIPLLPEAERLLAQYGDALPVPTNQVYNRFLKEIGALCHIEAARMTSHVGRKTAGTLLLNMGIPLPVVSNFLGHANTIITQKLYAKLLDTTVVDAFERVFSGAAAQALPMWKGGATL